MPRLFIGIPLPEHLKKELTQLRNQQEESLKWTQEVNLHITLYFFAEIPLEMQENLQSLLSLATQGVQAFRLEFDRTMYAPPGEQARMIWARYKKAETFLALNKKIHQLYQQIQPRLQRRRSPIPHITLARFKVDHKYNSWQLDRRVSDIEVNELILWESLVKAEGPIYEVIARYQLEQKKDSKKST